MSQFLVQNIKTKVIYETDDVELAETLLADEDFDYANKKLKKYGYIYFNVPKLWSEEDLEKVIHKF